VTLKIRLHCDGCIDRIKRRIYKIKGAVFLRFRPRIPRTNRQKKRLRASFSSRSNI
jgi:copper chaperone CopZ